MKNIPFLLIYSRILLGIFIGIIALWPIENYPIWIAGLMTTGLITDFFDGVIARHFNVASEKLRVWDSKVDQFFWITSIAAIFYLNIDFVKEHLFWIGCILTFEIAANLTSHLKFKKSIATHSILAKIWTLTLLTFSIDLVLHADSSAPFIACIILGIISRIEIIAIILKLDKWTTDVPSIFVVSKINMGVPFKKSKLLNG